MTFRRPVLDRKHRPRWQDELRSQQLLVAGFALAIAVAVGIFAASAWSSFYDANLRQVALIHGEPVQRNEMTQRTDMIAAEVTAAYLDLNSQLGGARDQVINQQLQTLQGTLQSIASVASDSMVTGAVLDSRAADYGITVSDEALQAEIDERRTLPARKQLSLILVFPVQEEGAPAGAEATEEARAAAKAEAEAILVEIEGGADFGELARERSDDQTKATDGLLGWVGADDGVFGEYFEAAGDAAAGEVLGPLENELGWYLLKVNEVQEGGRDETLDGLLAEAGVTEAEYRDYVRQEVLRQEFRDYFAETVIARYQPQRHVAQIFLQAEQGTPTPKIRVRHLLAQPIPGAEDQSTATQEQWDAALARAEEMREAALEVADEPWFELAEESDDSGSGRQGGYLGWYDPPGLATQFVPEFAQAATDLRIGDISQPVRSDFGYHIIQVTERRTSAQEQAERLVAELRDDPDTFAEMARRSSEDVTSAVDGGDLGWVVRYEQDAQRDQAIFDLTEIGQISDPVVTQTGIYIYQLLGTSEARFVPEAQRNRVASSGFSRWLEELKDEAGIWLDPEFAPSTGTAAAG
jgi:peptidyl-prolyl cis-trans isomerase SurA